MSSEIEPRITFLSQMKRKPANTVLALTGSWERAAVRILIRMVIAIAKIEMETAIANTVFGPRKIAYTIPPSAGPAMVAIWKMLEFHATALAKCSSGTS